MRRIALFTTLALALHLAASVPAAQGEDAVHPDDAALVVRVKAVLPPGGTIADLARALGTEAEDTRDLGFDATWRRFWLYAEALALWIDVLAIGPDIAAVQIRAEAESDALRKRIRTEWGDAVAVHADGVEYRHEVKPVLERLRAAVAKALGTPTHGPVPEADQEAVAALTDPLVDLIFGDVCNEDGSPPPGRDAVDALRFRASLAALDVVVRGPNPEGRLYAADALRLLEREGVHLGESLEDAVYDVLALEIPIRACSGCHHYEEQAKLLIHGGRMVGNVAGSIIQRVREGDRWVDVGKVIVYWDMSYVWRWRALTKDAVAEPSWHRGRIPHAVWERLYDTLSTGAGLLVHLGTPIYILHLDDTTLEPPPGIGVLHAHLLGTLPPKSD